MPARTCHICGKRLNLANRATGTNKCIFCAEITSPDELEHDFFYFTRLYPEMTVERIRSCTIQNCAAKITQLTLFYLLPVLLGAVLGGPVLGLFMGLVATLMIRKYRVIYSHQLLQLHRLRNYYHTMVISFWSMMAVGWVSMFMYWPLRISGDLRLQLNLFEPYLWLTAALLSVLVSLAITTMADSSRREGLASALHDWLEAQPAAA